MKCVVIVLSLLLNVLIARAGILRSCSQALEAKPEVEGFMHIDIVDPVISRRIFNVENELEFKSRSRQSDPLILHKYENGTVSLLIFGSSGKFLDHGHVDAKGKMEFESPSGVKYRFIFSRKNYRRQLAVYAVPKRGSSWLVLTAQSGIEIEMFY